MKICDCTLRDGGYYTNWDFNKDLVRKYLRTMESMDSIDIVELGYRSKPMGKYFGEYFYCPEYFLKEAKKIAPSKEFAIMLNEKSTDIADLDYLLEPCKGVIELVRLAVSPDNLERAINLALAIKKMGFKVAFNLMYMSKWANDSKFLDKLNIVNGLLDVIYLVDSFGSVLPKEVELSILRLKKIVNIPIGFHGHNNLELGLINSVKAIECGAEIIDATITGMGRGAGNLKTELLLTFLNAKKNIEVNFATFSDLVVDFEQLQTKHKWGTSFPYMISGAFSLPQAEVMGWMSKHRYTVHSIVTALQNKKNDVVDNLKLKEFAPEQSYDEAIIIGGGVSSLDVAEVVEKYIHKKSSKVCIIHAGGRFAGNYFKLEAKQYYCLVGAETFKLEASLCNVPEDSCLVAPYPRPMGTIISSSILGVCELKKISFCTEYHDSLLAISLQAAIDLKVKNVSLIGFDGYDLKSDDKMMEVAQENQFVIDAFLKEGVKLRFFTPTKYLNIIQESIYSYL